MKKSQINNYFSIKNQQKINIGLAVLLFLQGIIVLIVGHSTTLPINSNYLTSDQLLSQGSNKTISTLGIHHLFDVNLLSLVAILLFLSAIIRLLLATTYRPLYEEQLKKKFNLSRWLENALTGGLVLLVVALLSGIYDLSTLLLVVGFILAMNAITVILEISEAKTQHLHKWLLPLIWASGLISWLVILVYIVGNNNFGDIGTPGYMYGIYGSVFAVFVLIQVNLFFQIRHRKLWSNYIFSEAMFAILGFTMTTLLVWQVYAGALR